MSETNCHQGQASPQGVEREQRPEAAGQVEGDIARLKRARYRTGLNRCDLESAIHNGRCLGFDLHARDQVRECDTKDQWCTVAGDDLECVPGVDPLLRLDLRAPFDCNNAQNEQHQEQEERHVHAGEHSGIPQWECRKHRATSRE